MENQTNTPANFWESPSRANLNAAMVEFSKLNVTVKKDRDVEFITKSGGKMTRKYVTLDNIVMATKKPLAECGLFIEQHLAGDMVLTRLNHVSGEFVMSGFLFQKMDGNTLTNSLQNAGGGLSYIKRYAYSALLGIPSDDDMDGEDQHKSQGKKPIPVNQSRPIPPPPDSIPQDDMKALEEAKNEIWGCPDMVCLKQTWTKHRKWQKDPEFIFAKDGRKKELETMEAMGTIETPPTQITNPS
jgi:hypothetical protein